jgi:hypothetical protein
MKPADLITRRLFIKASTAAVTVALDGQTQPVSIGESPEFARVVVDQQIRHRLSQVPQ